MEQVGQDVEEDSKWPRSGITRTWRQSGGQGSSPVIRHSSGEAMTPGPLSGSQVGGLFWGHRSEFRDFLVVQWLRFRASSAVGLVLILGCGN